MFVYNEGQKISHQIFHQKNVSAFVMLKNKQTEGTDIKTVNQ